MRLSASRQDGLYELSGCKAYSTAFETIPRVAVCYWILRDESVSNYWKRPHLRQLVAAEIALPIIFENMILTILLSVGN